MQPAVLILIFLVVLPIAFYMRHLKEQSFEERLSQEIATRGGTVLHSETRTFRTGPFWVKGKGQVVMKVVYRDAEGTIRQLWGRTGLFGDDLDWEYHDGDNG